MGKHLEYSLLLVTQAPKPIGGLDRRFVYWGERMSVQNFALNRSLQTMRHRVPQSFRRLCMCVEVDGVVDHNSARMHQHTIR